MYSNPYATSSQQYVNPMQNELSAWFRSVDRDNSGRITAEELRQALVNGNWSNFSVEACRTLITLFDADKSGTIDFQEFQQLFNYINSWRSAFEAYDRDKSSSIDENELKQALIQMGYRLSDQTVSFIVNKFAISPKNRRVTFDSFIIACVQIHNLTGAFRSRDKELKGQINIGYEDFIQAVLQSF